MTDSIEKTHGDQLNNLLKSESTQGGTVQPKGKQIIHCKRKITGICNSLCVSCRTYNPVITIESISVYIEKSTEFNRILYSEISSYIFSLDTEKRGTYATNIEKLLNYSINTDNKVTQDIQKIVIKLYDHFQLALSQIENAKNIMKTSHQEIRASFENEFKMIQKEYITILGIFAAIILAFVGGITFSSSIFENFNKGSIYRLVLVIVLLSFVLFNTINILTTFIKSINQGNKVISRLIQSENGKKPITCINIVLLIVAILIIISWAISVTEIQHFLKEYIPWLKK